MLNVEFLERKKLGIFYTPSEATRILCQWAIRTPNDRILEPSFGACGFLEASRDRLVELKSLNPSKHLFGCDIDPQAFSAFLQPKFGDSDLQKRFIKKDFLRVTPEEFSLKKFDAVIGNPPYISYRNMSSAQRTSAAEALKHSDYSLDSKASLWAYFVAHGLNFLKPGGRIAWILPGSFLHAEYSGVIKDLISDNFERSLVIQLGQRLFSSEGTEENTAILLAEGWKRNFNRGTLKVDFASTLLDLQNVVSTWQAGKWEGKEYNTRIGYALLTNEVSKSICEIKERCETITLGDVADILIGIVTGANKFFVINQETAKQWNLPESSLKPILSKFNVATGIKLKPSDLKGFVTENFRCLLVDTSELKEEDLQLRVYLWTFPEKDKDENVTFQKREIWHQPNDGKIPDAFFPYMHHLGPRLVINNAGVTSTNTVHRVFFKPECNNTKAKASAISLLSTYGQLSAEIEGRIYGSGALRHEPSEAKRISLILPKNLNSREVEETFKNIDNLIRGNNHREVRKVADRFVLGDMPAKHSSRIIKIIDKALRAARARRYDSSESMVASK